MATLLLEREVFVFVCGRVRVRRPVPRVHLDSALDATTLDPCCPPFKGFPYLQGAYARLVGW